jgi:ribonuclease HIII
MTADSVRTLKLSRDQEQRLYDAWKEYEAKAPAYARFQLRPENCVITCYESGKTVFQGKDAAVYAAPFEDVPSVYLSSSPFAGRKDVLPQAGSDEVGTGDYFGPVCVCAAVVTEADMALIKELGVRDSKKLTDREIREIAPQLMRQLKYSLLIVDNPTYNRVHQNSNLNAIKAKLHNQAYVNLAKKVRLPSFKVIDQFAPAPVYYSYLKNEPVAVRGIHFETKAEDHYPAVGAASLIARYGFLVTMDRMEETWGMAFHKGAGTAVDECGREFIRRHGEENLAKVAKLHFQNTRKIREL